jgi:hypothetical protein
MDSDDCLVCNVASGTSEGNQQSSEPENVDVFCELPQLSNSFEDLEQELGRKELLSQPAESTDRPLEVMGIENTW